VRMAARRLKGLTDVISLRLLPYPPARSTREVGKLLSTSQGPARLRVQDRTIRDGEVCSMSGLRKGILSFVLAGALAAGGFVGGLMLSGGAASAATGGADTSLTGTTVAATPSASSTPKSNES